MKYSFVLPAYKATFFRDAVDSILNQTYADFELIIVNDGSPEDLTSIVNVYNDDRIQYYINEKNLGGTDLVVQWNHCISYATGDYLILASDDDIYHPDYLEKMDVLIDKYPNVCVFRPRVQHLEENGEISGETGVLDEYLSHVDFLYERYKGNVSSGIAYYIFKRIELMNIGGFVNFPTAWISDDATVMRLARNGVVSHGEALFAFRTSGLNISSKKNTAKMLADKLIATESFFKWYEQELKHVKVENKDDVEKINIISSSHNRKNMLESMLWLITVSDRLAVLSCLPILHRATSLNIFECLIICCRAFARIIMLNIRGLLSS